MSKSLKDTLDQLLPKLEELMNYLNGWEQNMTERKKLARQDWHKWFYEEQDLFNPNTVSDSLKIASWMAFKKARGVEDVWD